MNSLVSLYFVEMKHNVSNSMNRVFFDVFCSENAKCLRISAKRGIFAMISQGVNHVWHSARTPL